VGDKVYKLCVLTIGADVNKKDHLGFCALIHAAQFGSVFAFHHLVSNTKVDVNAVDNEGHSVLCWACFSGHKDLVEYMLSDNCPCVPHLGVMDNSHRTPMHWAASQNKPEICAFLANCKCKWCPENTHHATASVVELNGADDKETVWVGDKENSGASPVREACATGRQMLDMRDEDGKTPAECANVKGNTETAQLLEYERGGIRAFNSAPPTKDNTEQIYQFMSSFVPFIFLIFFATYLPYWAMLLLAGTAVGVHVTGRIKWTNSGKTLVPAGMLLASLLGMFWCVVTMDLSNSAIGLMIFAEVLLYYSYYILLFEDPGIIPPTDVFFKRALDVAAAGIEPTTDYCRKCKVMKPPRSKHCHICNICTDRHDHHCFWIYNCVAKKNYRRFYVFLLQSVGIIILFEYFTLNYLYARAYEEAPNSIIWDGVPHLINYYPKIFWVSAFFLFSFFPVTTLCVLHTTFIAKDVTTYEQLTHFRSTPGGAPKPFSVMRVIRFLQHGAGVFHNGSNGKDYEVMAV